MGCIGKTGAIAGAINTNPPSALSTIEMVHKQDIEEVVFIIKTILEKLTQVRLKFEISSLEFVFKYNGVTFYLLIV